MFPAFDYLTSFLERVDSPCSYIRLVCFSPGSNFWVTNCCCTPVGARRTGGRNGLHEVEIGREGGLFRCPLNLSCPPDVTSLYGALLCAEMRRLGGGHANGKGGRVAEKVDQYQAKRSAPLPTSVATRATTRPARCSRIDFVNPTWKTTTSPLLPINYISPGSSSISSSP